MAKVCVLGDGGWGTALTVLLHSKGVDTVLWSAFPEYAEYLDKKRENVKFLKGIKLPSDLKITSDKGDAAESEYAVFAVPCEYLAGVAEKFKDASFSYVISATKGIDTGRLRRPSEILKEVFPDKDIGVLSGPCIAMEVAGGVPTASVLAAEGEWKKDAQKLLTTERFRVYTAGDVTGVEFGGALKNIVAIAAGISDGLGFGANTKAAILTRGLAEIMRLGVKMGARKDTFYGLSGIGDLATTCISGFSRNRWFGEELARGKDASEIVSETEMVVEGMATSRAACKLADEHSVDMPITRKIYQIIYEHLDPGTAVNDLMTRDLKEE